MSLKDFIKDSWSNLPALMIITVALIVLMTHSYISADAKTAGFLAHLVGTLFYGGAFYTAYKLIKDDWYFGVGSGVAILALIALGALFNLGYIF